jgi:ribosomal protein S1
MVHCFQAKIAGANQGGLLIDLMGLKGFLPISQLAPEHMPKNTEDRLRAAEELKELVGQELSLKVITVIPRANKLILSERGDATPSGNMKELLEKYAVGQVVPGVVSGIADFGIFVKFVDNPEIEGLVHISEISWEKVTDVAPLVTVGEDIDVAVVEKNEEDLKLNLSIKRLAHDPWETIEEKYPKDREVDGEVVRHERYGYFVRLEPGIEGLIHSSKLSGTEHYEVGQKIKAFIDRVNKQSRRLSLIPHQSEKPVMYR